MLGDQIECKSCKRVFVPANASKRRLQRQNPATPFLIGGGVLVVAIVIGAMITGGGGGSQTQSNTPAVKIVETGDKNARVRDVKEWLTAVQMKENGKAAPNAFKLNQISDYVELGRFLGIGTNVPPSEMGPAVLKELTEGDRARFLRDGEVTAAFIDKTEAESDSGSVSVSISLLSAEDKAKYQRPTGDYKVRFRASDGRFRVIGWDVVYEPQPRAPKKTRNPTHQVLGNAQDVERTVNGQKAVVREAELKPLEHLEGTPPEQRKQIDDDIATLIDPEALPQQANRADIRLRKIGKPAVPRLLNKLYEFATNSKIDETRLQVRKVTQALEDITGQRFGFDPSSAVAGNLAKEEYRMSALKQWYGWWADNFWREDISYAIEKEESLTMPAKKDGSPEPDPKKPDPAKK